MIDASSKQILSAFLETWNQRLSRVPSFSLDSTWPSVGTIDLLTFGLRLQPELPKQVDPLVKGSAVYLAMQVASCWQTISEECTVRNEAEDGICVEAKGGEHLPEPMRFPVEKVLRECLRELPDPFPVLRGLERRISFQTNIVSLITLGGCMGVSPFVTGPWQEKTFKELKSPLQEISKELAKQTADYYARCFPDEPLGAVAELYLSALIFPPLLVGEEVPGVAAVRQLAEFAEKFKVKPSQLNKLAANWVRIPDETLASVGLVVYCATAEGPIAPHVMAYAHSNSRAIGILRFALNEARGLLTPDRFSYDWIQEGIQNEADEARFEQEFELQFLPWLSLPMERFKKEAEYQKYTPLLEAMCAFNFEDAVRRIDALVEQEPGDIELRLQRIKLDMIIGDWEKCISGFRSLLSEDEADSSVKLFHYWSLVALGQGDAATASKYCKAGLAVAVEDDLLRPDLSNNLGWALLMAGELEDSLPYFNEAAESMSCPVTPMLNRAHVLWRLGRQEEAQLLRRKLLQLAPCDRRVFNSLAAGDAEESGKRKKMQ